MACFQEEKELSGTETETKSPDFEETATVKFLRKEEKKPTKDGHSVLSDFLDYLRQKFMGK